MLRKKITTGENNKHDDDKETGFHLKKSGGDKNEAIALEAEERAFPSRGNSGTVMGDERRPDTCDVGEWFVANILPSSGVSRLRDELLIPIANIDRDSSDSEWLNMFLKSYLHKEELDVVTENLCAQIMQSVAYKKIQKKNAILVQEISRKNEVVTTQQNKIIKMQRKIDKMCELSKVVECSFMGLAGCSKIELLLQEAIDADSDNLAEFIIPFSMNCRQIVMLKNQITNDIDDDILLYQAGITFLLKSISGKYIPQRKELLDELAVAISMNFKDAKFVSPESYTFVEPKIHNIPVSGGQKVLEGVSFAVVVRETDQTMIHADIKAQ